ncbi:MAG: hypothetical protein F6K55_21240 [Moorea sp. SIO4A3]|nr:hypothetical protein [Moorena sp. SIO4A3]
MRYTFFFLFPSPCSERAPRGLRPQSLKTQNFVPNSMANSCKGEAMS